MPLKRARKNATPENRQKVIDNNMGILFNANRSKPPGEKKTPDEIKAAALNAADNLKTKRKK
jgi:hypothetical protein